jgi:hypothetical protein
MIAEYCGLVGVTNNSADPEIKKIFLSSFILSFHISNFMLSANGNSQKLRSSNLTDGASIWNK